ncbi:MAG: response regulator [Nitrospira sp.]|nr:response regulator [Nitrospira sp.]
MSTTLSQNGSKVKPTILVVDDEAGPRDALKVILRPFFNIRSADNAQAALDVLSHESVDLITLDQKLPDRQGIDLLQDIKHDHADIEVIIITGYGSLKSAMEGIRHGAAGYLLKPFNVTELISLISQTLEKKQRLDLLRKTLTDSPALWAGDEEGRRAWETLKTSYFAIGTREEQDSLSGSPDLLPLLSDLMEAKDRQLLSHCSRVSFYATLLANRLSLTLAEQKSLAIGAFLHDIGKVSLPNYHFWDEPILPSGESALSKEHCETGARMILPLGYPAEVGQVISSHHERWDGSGYPHGLQGEGIPLLARIVSIAQLFDHLTAEAPGRSPLSVDQAIQQIALHANTYFDPMLVDQFARVATECKASLSAMAIATTPNGVSSL